MNQQEDNTWDWFDHMEDRIFQTALRHYAAGGRQMHTDIVDEGGQYLLLAELPGFEREDIQIDLHNDTLIIKAERKDESSIEEDQFIHREYRDDALTRSFDVSDINTNEIKAHYKRGVLMLELPKKPETAPPPARHINID